jgi:hypothetical protein
MEQHREHPFAFGKWLGTDMAQKGWKIQGKSRELLEHEARKLIVMGLPDEDEETQNTIISGILHAWNEYQDQSPLTDMDHWL